MEDRIVTKSIGEGVTLTGLDRNGTKITHTAEGLLSRIFQHEIDHLKGRLFVDRLSLFQRRRIRKRYNDLANQLRDIDLKP